VNGAIDPTTAAAGGIAPGDQGTNPGDEPIRFTGVPIAFNIYRPVENEWDVWTWRANIDFEPNPDTLLYLSATTGWRSGGYNLGFFSTATPEYDEENILAYELGYKGTWMDGRMQVNSSIYLYQYDDIHTSVTQSGGLLGTSTNIINFPEAETFGWEGEIMYLLGDNLTLGGNWSYTNAEFTEEFSIIDVNNPDLPQSIFTAGERTVSGFDGASLPKIPEWKFTVWGNYSWSLGDSGTLDLFTTVGYTDEFFFNAPFQRDLDRAPSFTRWDARASWTSVSETWEVSAFVNNITNELGVGARCRNRSREPELPAHRDDDRPAGLWSLAHLSTESLIDRGDSWKARGISRGPSRCWTWIFYNVQLRSGMTSHAPIPSAQASRELCRALSRGGRYRAVSRLRPP
jgi:iron complex outermembrane receptor protein